MYRQPNKSKYNDFSQICMYALHTHTHIFTQMYNILFVQYIICPIFYKILQHMWFYVTYLKTNDTQPFHQPTPLLPGERNGNPLQYSCLENSTNRGAWLATVHRVTKSQTQLSSFHSFGLPWWLSSKEPTCQYRGFNPCFGKSPGEGNGCPLQYSFLKNPMDRGASWATIHGVSKELDTT